MVGSQASQPLLLGMALEPRKEPKEPTGRTNRGGGYDGNPTGTSVPAVEQWWGALAAKKKWKSKLYIVPKVEYIFVLNVFFWLLIDSNISFVPTVFSNINVSKYRKCLFRGRCSQGSVFSWTCWIGCTDAKDTTYQFVCQVWKLLQQVLVFLRLLICKVWKSYGWKCHVNLYQTTLLNTRRGAGKTVQKDVSPWPHFPWPY